MRLSRPTQSGFAAIEAFLIVIVLTIIIGTGYYVWHANQKSNDTYNAAAMTAQSSPPKKPAKKSTAVDSTAGWKPYSGSSISFKYPSSWTLTVCDTSSILLGPTLGTAGHCNSDNIAQIQITIMEGDQVQNALFKPVAYPDLQITSVNVAGGSGKKQTATLHNESDTGIGLPNGTKFISYLLLNKGKTVNMAYSQTLSQTDVSGQFELIVNKTLKLQ
jgi:hypothetical protein